VSAAANEPCRDLRLGYAVGWCASDHQCHEATNPNVRFSQKRSINSGQTNVCFAPKAVIRLPENFSAPDDVFGFNWY